MRINNALSICKTANNNGIMKTKICEICTAAAAIMFRIQITSGKNWMFVCQSCCENSKPLPHYRYGGTWKGKRH